MSNTKHTIHAATIGSTVLPGVSGQAVEHTAEMTVAAGAGDHYARGHFTTQALTTVELRTRAIHTMLGKLELTTVSPQLNLADAGKSLELVFAKALTKGDGYEASASISYEYAVGLGWLASLASGPGGIWQATLRAIPCSSDGTTAPGTRSASAAVPSLPTSTELYRTASVTVGGTALSRWADIGLEINAAAEPLYQGADLHPRDVLLGGPAGLIAHDLSIGVEELDVAYALAGQVGAEVTTVIVLKPLSRDGTLGAGSNITLTHYGTVQPAAPRGEAHGAASDALRILGRYDGSHLPLTITVA